MQILKYEHIPLKKLKLSMNTKRKTRNTNRNTKPETHFSLLLNIQNQTIED